VRPAHRAGSEAAMNHSRLISQCDGTGRMAKTISDLSRGETFSLKGFGLNAFFPIQRLVFPCWVDIFSFSNADAPLLCFARWRKGSFWRETLCSPVLDSLV